MWMVWLVSVNRKIKREETFFEKYDRRKRSDFLHVIGLILIIVPKTNA